MKKIAQVAIDKATYEFDKLYDYAVPDALSASLLPGCRVIVPFGRANHRRLAVVCGLSEVQENAVSRIKEIDSLVDEQPLLSGEMLELIAFLKHNTFCTYYDAVKAMLPFGIGVNIQFHYMLAKTTPADLSELDDEAYRVIRYLQTKPKGMEESKLLHDLGLRDHHPVLKQLYQAGWLTKTESVKRKIQDEKQLMVRLTEQYETIEKKLTTKQQSVVRLLEEVGFASIKEVAYYAASTRAVVDRLVDYGIACYFEEEVFRNPYEGMDADSTLPEIALSESQQQAYTQLLGYCKEQRDQVALLHGVTGSGKTQVFLKLIQQVVGMGRKVIVMVPEISLTPQTIAHFHQRFGQAVAVLHSGLSLGQRLDEWKRIRQGHAQIVVGTRSAVFAPLDNIGLIVVDEEQERTYQSENAPRYHAVEVAKFRCRYHKAPLLLCSATPLVESYYAAKKGRYQLIELNERFGAAVLPDVTIVDMSDRSVNTGGIISQTLGEELLQNLEQKQQSILLLNRRGYHTIVQCSSCHEVVKCPHCSVALTFHSANGRMVCHYCGYSAEAVNSCPSCHSNIIRYGGIGTQLVEEQLKVRFPDARILRMDMDTTMSRFAHERKFAAFAAGEYDIMVGTQMVAKGLDFPNVTLVGVLNADQSLYSQDYRSFEQTFGLITQVVGRCGRGILKGRALIQTYTPDNPVIGLAASQRYEDFYAEEIAFRKMNLYPPFCQMLSVGFVSTQEKAVAQSARWFLKLMAALSKEKYADLPLRLLGPVQESVYKTAGKYRMRLTLKCKKDQRMSAFLDEALCAFYRDPNNKLTTAFIDPNYQA